MTFWYRFGICYYKVLQKELLAQSAENKGDFEKLFLMHQTLYPFTNQKMIAMNVKNTVHDFEKEFVGEGSEVKKRKKLHNNMDSSLECFTLALQLIAEEEQKLLREVTSGLKKKNCVRLTEIKEKIATKLNSYKSSVVEFLLYLYALKQKFQEVKKIVEIGRAIPKKSSSFQTKIQMYEQMLVGKLDEEGVGEEQVS